MKLIIYNEGDRSVGLNPYHYELLCPFEKEDVEDEVLKWFKEIQLKTYQECLDLHVKAYYDYEFID